MQGPNGKMVTRTVAPPAKKAETTQNLSQDGFVKAGSDGAVFLRIEQLDDEFQGPYTTMSQVSTTNVFPWTPHVPADVVAMQFPFLKVETLPWATSGCEDLLLLQMSGS